MGAETADCSKGPTAFRALERLFPAMHAPVFREIVTPSKHPTTVRTLICRLPVQSHMVLEGLKHFATNWALIQRLLRVRSLRMIHRVADSDPIHQLSFDILHSPVILNTGGIYHVSGIWNRWSIFVIGLQAGLWSFSIGIIVIIIVVVNMHWNVSVNCCCSCQLSNTRFNNSDHLNISLQSAFFA